MRHLCVSLTELCIQLSSLSLCLAGNFHDVTEGDLLVGPFAKLASVTNFVVLIFFNIHVLIFYFRQLHYEFHLMSDQLSFNDLIGRVCSFLFILLCKLTHVNRQVLIVYNAVNVR